ncbi:hypothetical protein D9758_011328 [Tetrapyrgos nigripes]|uniref:Uncharacterized protein n=1 Tax=Tetrapyrgos nigripes TaxID=182062 RepID=A0A8H5LK64_9AGAR|nr:hypothetical protein D9758_011328 [Tetrapyrgos nigripes]
MNYAFLVPPHLVAEGIANLLQTFISSSSYLITSLSISAARPVIGTVGSELPYGSYNCFRLAFATSVSSWRKYIEAIKTSTFSSISLPSSFLHTSRTQRCFSCGSSKLRSVLHWPNSPLTAPLGKSSTDDFGKARTEMGRKKEKNAEVGLIMDCIEQATSTINITSSVHTVTTHLLSVFGLTHAKNTLVGDTAIRGVSGGEKKRVRFVRTYADSDQNCSSTRGLDASTPLEYVRALRAATDLGKMTTIASLYETGENLYKYFDKVCVIYEGKLAFFGAASSARQYFIDMGYESADRQTTADFLVAVTDPTGRIPRSPSSTIPVGIK